jgi:hypothetical protein
MQTRAERYFAHLAHLPNPSRSALFAPDWRLIEVRCFGCGREGLDQEAAPSFGYCGACFAKMAHIALPCVVCGRGPRDRPPLAMYRLSTPGDSDPLWACEAHRIFATGVAAALEEALL